MKLLLDEDQQFKIVRKFHKIHTKTNLYSIFKDATRYANEIGLTFRINEDGLEITGNEKMEAIKENVGSIRKNVKGKHFNRNQSDVLNSNWQGVNTEQRFNDENVVKTFFHWLRDWKMCPTNVIQEYFLLFYLLFPTKQYMSIRSKDVIEDMSCRIRHLSQQESIKHLVSNCSVFANGLYKKRHDNALKSFV